MKIAIRIPKDPRQPRSVRVDGVVGQSCMAMTEKIEQGLGRKVSDEATNEYYLEQQQDQEQEQQG
jgi:hypothetical protein